MEKNPSQFTFILSRTRFASNLGGAARVMKNMGIPELILVRPRCEVGSEARTRAMRGAGLIDRAVVLPSLEEAGGRVDLLVGTSSRFGPATLGWISSRGFAEKVVVEYRGKRIGVAFGSEDNGLRREEIRLCDWLIEIPTSADYPVINLAQAVGLIAYDLRMALLERSDEAPLRQADPADVRALIEHTGEILSRTQSSPHLPIGSILERLGKMAGRTRLEPEDVQLLRGLLRHLRGRS